MKYIILLFIILTGIVLMYKYVISDDTPPMLKEAIQKQSNPFSVSKDSGEAVWKRAFQLLQGRKNLLAGGDLAQTDSTLFLPYYNDSHKGNSILIERKPLNDSIRFTVNWYQYNKLSQAGSKEIALFMQKGISRYGKF